MIMANTIRRRMCACCGEWYHTLFDVGSVADMMCVSCLVELEEMDGPELELFIADAEKVIAIDESRAKRGEQTPTVEEIIAVMDH